MQRLPARDQRGTVAAMNAEPKIRVVGKRNPSNYNSGGLKAGDNLLRLLRDLRGNRPFIPHGVYRFKSHEESDAWMMKMLTRATAGPEPRDCHALLPFAAMEGQRPGDMPAQGNALG